MARRVAAGSGVRGMGYAQGIGAIRANTELRPGTRRAAERTFRANVAKRKSNGGKGG